MYKKIILLWFLWHNWFPAIYFLLTFGQKSNWLLDIFWPIYIYKKKTVLFLDANGQANFCKYLFSESSLFVLLKSATFCPSLFNPWVSIFTIANGKFLQEIFVSDSVSTLELFYENKCDPPTNMQQHFHQIDILIMLKYVGSKYFINMEHH